jgi:prepilin-type N-terminal cleavage/methylation domain-containing protein
MSDQRGLTLIELVVVVALTAIIGMVVVEMFLNQTRIFRVQHSELNVQNDTRMALDDIDAFVRSATRAMASYGAYIGGPTVAVLQIQSINASDQLIPGTFDQVVFYLDGNRLMREIIPDAASSREAFTRQVAANVASLNFVYNNADFAQVTEIETQLTLTDANNVQSRTFTSSSKSRLRNY